MDYLHWLKTLLQINMTEEILTTEAATKRCSPKKQLLLDLQNLK